MVELLCPVWDLPSTLAAADCLDHIIGRGRLPARHGEDSGLEIKPGVHKDPQRFTTSSNVLSWGSHFLVDAFKLSGLNEFQLHFILFSHVEARCTKCNYAMVDFTLRRKCVCMHFG